MDTKPHLPPLDAQLTWRATAGWYLAAVVVAFVGTWLAYGPLTSDAWTSWAGAGAWKRDTLRAVVTASLAVIALSNLQAIAPRSASSTFTVRRYEIVLLLSALAVLATLVVLVLPESFKQGLVRRGSDIPHTFREIYFPYIPYSLYMLAFWIGIVFPVLLFVLRAIGSDAPWSRDSWNALQRELAALANQRNSVDIESLHGLLLRFENHVLGLKGLAQRYIPVVLVIAITLGYEQLTPSGQTVTEAGLDISKALLWLLLGPMFLVSLLFVVYRYQRASEAMTAALTHVAAKARGNSDLFRTALSTRSEIVWKRGTLQFVFSIFQSATFTVAFMIAVSSYVLSSAVGGERLAYILVPRAVVDFVKGLFG